jgi:hypothetical protein
MRERHAANDENTTHRSTNALFGQQNNVALALGLGGVEDHMHNHREIVLGANAQAAQIAKLNILLDSKLHVADLDGVRSKPGTEGTSTREREGERKNATDIAKQAGGSADAPRGPLPAPPARGATARRLNG